MSKWSLRRKIKLTIDTVVSFSSLPMRLTSAAGIAIAALSFVYALYLAIVADAFAAIPTIVSVWSHPDSDRPFAWLCFSVGYGLAILAITEQTIANYALPLYMSLGSLCIAFPLARYRQRKKAALAEWI